MTNFLPQEIIRRKRNGFELGRDEIRRFVDGITDGSVSDAHISAFAMAVFFRGMTTDEGADLMAFMRDSGAVVDWQAMGFDADAPITDKHSTGGVGDKVSLMLTSIVAACGGLVPMISGRGLGHTGGTLDKLEAIPGFDAYPTITGFAEIVRNVGCSIIGQTNDLVPADRRFYSVRDVTATVESVPLITASILSKKLAAGLGSLVCDVKFGTGAFMATYEEAETLARTLVDVAKSAGTPTRALITDMNWVLGRTAGNGLEILETIEFLKDPAAADRRLMDLTLDLAAHMLVTSGLEEDVRTAHSKAEQALASGRAADRFARMVAAQGGPSDLLEKVDHYVKVAPVTKAVPAAEDGYVGPTDARALGVSVVALGGGRIEPKQRINHSVGLSDIVAPGKQVSAGDPLMVVHAESEAAADMAIASITDSVAIVDSLPLVEPVVRESIQ